ncbi:MAG: CAP domain-containing protein [Thermonemataceae bacterium]|nr:CAP domain-containing protein [Thermonemataceae bacterium]
MKILIAVCLLFFGQSAIAQNAEIKQAFDYLNKIRANPSMFSQEIGINLSQIPRRSALQWNDTLASIAQKKAEDMAKKNYFSHTDPNGNGINILLLQAGYHIPEDWTVPKSNNYFESLSAGAISPKEGIIYLLKDGGVSNHKAAGHRNHLLGIDKFYANLTDIGIGWAKGGKYGTYLCVIIAKHQW